MSNSSTGDQLDGEEENVNLNNQVYIGNISPDFDDQKLRTLLMTQSIHPTSLYIDPLEGFAYVELPDQESVTRLIDNFNGYEYLGSQFIVQSNVPQHSSKRNNHQQPQHQEPKANKLLICNIPNHVQWEDIRRILSSFGSFTNLEQGNLKTDTGFSVIVTFETEEELQQAFNQLNGQEYEGSTLKAEIMEQQGGGRSSRGPNRGTGGNRGGYRPSGYTGTPSAPARPTDFPLRILVLSDMVGAIIGRSGGTIRQITQDTRARVDVHRKENAGSLEKVITIYGNPENCSKACQKIMEVMQQESNNTSRGEIPLKILAHNNLIGRIIGKSGNTIKRIMEQTDTKITVSTNIHDVNSFNLERVITIKGKLEDICKAEQMISSKLRQSYESDLAAMAPQTLMFPGLHPMAMMSTLGSSNNYARGAPPSAPNASFGMYGGPSSYMPQVLQYGPSAAAPPPPAPMSQSGAPPMTPSFQGDQQKETVFLYIPNSAVGAIIGTGGSTIRDMISSSGASIKVAQPSKEESQQPLQQQQPPPPSPQGDKSSERKVTLIGTPEAQWKAQFMIFRKVGYEGLSGPQEATLKVEIFVPSSQVGRIIGKGGNTVRDLQRLTHAIIKLPEEGQTATATDETPVHIIGDFLSTQAAQRQIRALVTRGTQTTGQQRTRVKPLQQSTPPNHQQLPQEAQQQPIDQQTTQQYQAASHPAQ